MNAASYTRLLGEAHLLRIRAQRLEAIDDAIAAIDRSEALGAVLHPTLYRDQAQRMAEDREVLVAVRDLARLGS